MKAILPNVAPAQIARRDSEVLALLRQSAQPPITKEQSLIHHATYGGQNLRVPILHLPIPTSLLNPGLPSEPSRAQGQTAGGDDPTDLASAVQAQIDSDAAEARRLQDEEYDRDEKRKAKEGKKRQKAERKRAREEQEAEEARANEERKMAKRQRREARKAEKEMKAKEAEEAEKEMPTEKVEWSAEERAALFDEFGSPPPPTPPPAQPPAWEGFSDPEDDDDADAMDVDDLQGPLQFPLRGPLADIHSTPPESPLKHKSASAAPVFVEEDSDSSNSLPTSVIPTSSTLVTSDTIYEDINSGARVLRPSTNAQAKPRKPAKEVTAQPKSSSKRKASAALDSDKEDGPAEKKSKTGEEAEEDTGSLSPVADMDSDDGAGPGSDDGTANAANAANAADETSSVDSGVACDATPTTLKWVKAADRAKEQGKSKSEINKARFKCPECKHIFAKDDDEGKVRGHIVTDHGRKLYNEGRLRCSFGCKLGHIDEHARWSHYKGKNCKAGTQVYAEKPSGKILCSYPDCDVESNAKGLTTHYSHVNRGHARHAYKHKELFVKYYCDVCQYRFPDKWMLFAHLHNHKSNLKTAPKHVKSLLKHDLWRPAMPLVYP
jgi:hypothetical protein